MAWCCLLPEQVQAIACSPNVNDMTINEVYELGGEVWVETKLLDESLDADDYSSWTLDLCIKNNCGTYQFSSADVINPGTFPNHFILEVSGSHVDLSQNGGMDAVLLDGTGQCIDYLSVNEFSDQTPSCTGFSYPTATGALASSPKGIFRDADGTGPWYELEGGGATGEPTKGASNTGLEGVVDHYRIEHPASALTCHSAEITVRACENSDCSSYYGDTVDLTLAPVSGWVGGNEQSFDSGIGIFQLRQASAGSITLDLSANPAPGGANRCTVGGVDSDCSMVFYDAGFVVSVPDLTSCQRSELPSIQAVRKDEETEACVADGGFAGQTKTVGFWADYLQPDTGSEVPRINNIPLTSASPGNAVALVFDNEARSTFALTYDDAGQLQLNARYEGSGDEVGLIMTGNDSFVVAPHSLRVIATSDGTAPLDNNSFSGDPLWAAGENFFVEVAGVCSDGTVTPNFSASTSLNAVDPFAPVTGVRGALTGDPLTSVDYSSGVALADDISYSEVGTVTIDAEVLNYLGSGLDVTGSSGLVGRFTPHHFLANLNTPQFATGCSSGSFTYFGQPFNYVTAPVITVTAQNLQNGDTQNYAGDWWKISSRTLSGKEYNAATGTVDDSQVPAGDPSVTELGSGMGLLIFSAGSGFKMDRGVPTAPDDADISLEINVIDGDAVDATANPVRFGAATAGNGISFDNGNEMRWGRLILNNAYGSELVALPMPLRVEYYESTSVGDAFVLNVDDSCTGLFLSQITLNNGSVTVTADNPIVIGSGTTSASLLSSMVAGDANLSFSAPGDEGFIDVSADLSSLDWLRYDWDGDGNHDDNPLGRATFGIFKGRPSIIYLRETYR